MTRVRVRTGMERAAGESFNTADTVPAVSPRCSATARSVTAPGFRMWSAFVDFIIWFRPHLGSLLEEPGHITNPTDSPRQRTIPHPQYPSIVVQSRSIRV